MVKSNKNVKKNEKKENIITVIYYVACVLVIASILIVGYKKIDDNAKKERAIKVQEYKECIQQQSDKQGWIIRSYCSLDYASLDAEAGLVYEQKGYDLYLKK